MAFSLAHIDHPIVLAPLGGGPSTPALAAAVSEAGGLGFLAAGYREPDAVREEIEKLRRLTSRPFGVNLFVPGVPSRNPGGVARYAESLAGEASRYGVDIGEPRYDDDGWKAKLALVREEAVPVVSFTFGCPEPGVLESLREAGCASWVTVTGNADASAATDAGTDALVVQGFEAGGHRGSHEPGAAADVGLLALLQLVREATELPLVATGGIATGRGVAAVLAAGAAAAQLGTAFMLTPEAGTSPAHREAIRGSGQTAVTRAFTGRPARGIENRFMREHGTDAPLAYPEVHNLTAPVRAAARAAGDAEGFHLWAGQTHCLAAEVPAGELVSRLAAEARDALASAEGALAHRPERGCEDS
jgi:nitronate monooxygenase